MHFANPYLFILVIFIFAFIFFYFFRKQYSKQVIPSNLLWDEVLKEMKATTWLHKWQNNLLFWLQLFALILLLFALVQPYVNKETLKGEQLLFLFDTSASMAASSNGPNGLEESKQMAINLVKQLHKNQSITVMEVSDEPHISLNNETDINKIISTIQDIDVSYTHENFDKATEMAVTLAKEGKTAIHVFSDKATKESLENLQNVYTEVHNVDRLDEGNIAIQSFGVAKQQEQIAGIAVVSNNTLTAQTIPFFVESEGNILFEQELSINANEQKIVEIPNLPEKSYYTSIVDFEDVFPVDNNQTAVFNTKSSSIYVSNTVNPFLIKGLVSIGANVVQMENENDFSEKKDGVQVISGKSMPTNLHSPTIFFYKNLDKVELQKDLETVEDELLSHVDMSNVYMKSAVNETVNNFTTILKSGEIPLIQKGTIDGQPIIVFNVDIEDSDWPLHQSFPLFLYNCFQWLTSQTEFIGDFQPQEQRTLTLSDENGNWNIYNEKDQLVKEYNPKTGIFQAPSLPGLYQLSSDDQLLYFSVNLDDREKTIVSEESFIWNKEMVEPVKSIEEKDDTIIYILLLLIFIILLIEWEVYRRAHRV